MKYDSECVRWCIFRTLRLHDVRNVKAACVLLESHLIVNIVRDKIEWEMLRMVGENCLAVLGVECFKPRREST